MTARRTTPLALALLGALAAPPAPAQPIGQSQQGLSVYRAPLWTEGGRHIPMCWHEFHGFASPAAAARARDFVRRAIEEHWIAVLNLTIGWEDCPAAGEARHVRVMLRAGDPNPNGTTKSVGRDTLSTAAERRVPPPNDAPGLLMGFPADWDAGEAGRAALRALTLHEFGHILGFGHEQDRTDGPASAECYAHDFPGARRLGPPDPASIMGWSYCATADAVLTPGDVAGARAIYGRGHSFDRLAEGVALPPGAPLALAAQADGALVAVGVSATGIPAIAWQRDGANWGGFVRVAAPDARFPDGFRVPPGAPVSLARQGDGRLVAAVVGHDGVPYLSWQRPGQGWHPFERVAAPDPRFGDGFTVPPGAPLALARQADGMLVLAVVGRDGVPYLSWQRPNQPWHRFEALDLPDGLRFPPGAAVSLGAGADGRLALAIVAGDGVPWLSRQRPGAPWSRFERLAPPDARYADGFTLPPGSRVTLAASPREGGALRGVATGRDGVPYLSFVTGGPLR